jgi:tetratricopeptide (TPR) repeat protein
VVTAKAGRPPRDGIAPPSEPDAGWMLLGRERELATLSDALDAASSGKGRLVLIRGEAGIGKTRLADGLAREAMQRGARVLWGRCWEAGGAPAYWPWLQAIRSYLAEADRDAVERALGTGGEHLARILPELRELVTGLPEMTPEDTEASRFHVFEAASRFLRTIAAARPLVLILDDLHAADEPSLRLLDFLAADVADAAMLVVGLYREEFEAGDPRAELLADLARARSAIRLDPRGLDQASVARLIERVAATAPDHEVVEAIWRQTEGNPLFVGEVVRLLAAEGRLGRLDYGDGRLFGVPEGVGAVIGRRLARLSPQCRSLLARASVLGVEIPLELLARLEGSSRENLLLVLDEAVSARVVLEPGYRGSQWRYGHALIREVLYESLPGSARIELHLRAGTALEEMHEGSAEPPLAELAHHFLEARAGQKAAGHALRAARKATELLAYEEAVRLYLLALDAGAFEDAVCCRLLLELGEAASRAGDQARMRQTFLEAAAMAERLGLAEEYARAAIGYGGKLVHRRAGDDARLVPLLERALELLPADDGVLRVRILARLAGALRDQPTMERRMAIGAEAVAMARRIGDPVALGYALQGRQTAIWGPDSLAEMATLLDEAEAIATRADDREQLAQLHWNRVVVLKALGSDSDSIRAEIDAGSRLAAELRQPALDWYRVQLLAEGALSEGRIADAERLLEETRQRGGPVSWDADFSYRCGIVLVRREQGRLGEVVELIHRAVDDFPGYRSLAGLAAYVEAVAGHGPAARAALDDLSRDGFAYFPRDLGWPFGMTFTAETAIVLGDQEVAGAVAKALQPYAGLFGTASGLFPSGPVDRVLGLLVSFAGDLDEADARLGTAAASSARTGARLWDLHATVERAEVLARRGRSGDRELATRLAEHALESGRALGLSVLADQARAVLRETGRSPRSETRSGAAWHRAGTFHREGDYWAIEYGTLTRLRDAKGLRYLAQLLANPGREFHALDMVSPRRPGVAPVRESESLGLGLHLDGTVAPGQGIDEVARSEYRARLRDLEAELAEAEAYHDPGRVQRAQAEMAALEAELSNAFGLGGRARPGASAAERARQSVTKAIRDALARIAASDEALGAHLSRSVRTGLYCVYEPDPDAAPHWTF